MAIYEYRCKRDGAFDLVARMGEAPATAPCPACAGESARVFTNPMLGTFAPRELVAALDRQERTRHEPEVVTSLPRAGHRKPTPMARMTPELARLPRP